MKKRNGIRCTLQDGNVNQFGRDPKTGFARRPLDNVGVQYGLKALNAKKISVDQFLLVNQAAGGYTIDGRHQPQREVADPIALRGVVRGRSGVDRAPATNARSRSSTSTSTRTRPATSMTGSGRSRCGTVSPEATRRTRETPMAPELPDLDPWDARDDA